jgi:hypothetical protein
MQKLLNDIINIFKLIGIMYISISLKNILQILFGTLFGYSGIAESYGLINLKQYLSFEAKINIISIMMIYDFTLFTLLFYFWLFLLSYLVFALIGNKLWFHIVYSIVIYLLIIFRFDNFRLNILFIIITIILGCANWWMFKKYLL